MTVSTGPWRGAGARPEFPRSPWSVGGPGSEGSEGGWDPAGGGAAGSEEAPPVVVGANPDAPIDLRKPDPFEADPLPRPLDGRVAVVTGGGDAVGRAVALALLDAGARVCVMGRDAASLRDTTAAAGPHAPILYLQCDLGSVAEVEGAADFIARFDRPVDVLVHAAQVHVAHSLAAGPVTDLDEQYLVNVRGPYLLTQKLLPQLVAGPGQVVFLVEETQASADVQYAMTAAAVDGLATGLRGEVEPTGVRVAVVRPRRAPGAEAVDSSEIALGVVAAVGLPPAVDVREIAIRPTADLTF